MPEWWARGPPYLLETVPTGIVAQTLMPLGTKKTFDDFVGKP